jgi:hypothetical protein
MGLNGRRYIIRRLLWNQGLSRGRFLSNLLANCISETSLSLKYQVQLSSKGFCNKCLIFNTLLLFFLKCSVWTREHECVLGKFFKNNKLSDLTKNDCVSVSYLCTTSYTMGYWLTCTCGSSKPVLRTVFEKFRFSSDLHIWDVVT